MNKAYRVVWNAHTSTWAAVQKNVKAKGKAAASGLASITSAILGKSPRVAYAAVASAIMMAAGSANAGPGIFVSAAAYYSVNDGGTHGGNYSGNGATQPGALAAGVGASSTLRDSVAIGTNAKAGGSNTMFSDAVAIGTNSQAEGNAALAIGPSATVTGSNGQGGIAIGAVATAQNGGMAIGSGANSGNGTAIIPGLPDRLNNNLALGDSATVRDNTNFNVALGSFSTAGDADLTAAAYKPAGVSTVAGDVGEQNVKIGEVSLGGDVSNWGGAEKMYRRLTNLAAGSADTDGVNVSQLKAVQAAVAGVNSNFDARIGQVKDAANAGTASAMAAAGLPQAYLPGKSMIAVSASTYRGQQGYAVGISTISDSGNWIIKGFATGNSKGHFGATVGAGYQW